MRYQIRTLFLFSGVRVAAESPNRWSVPAALVSEGSAPRTSFSEFEVNSDRKSASQPEVGDADNLRTQLRSVRVIVTEYFSQWLAIKETFAPFVQLVDASGANTILNARG